MHFFLGKNIDFSPIIQFNSAITITITTTSQLLRITLVTLILISKLTILFQPVIFAVVYRYNHILLLFLLDCCCGCAVAAAFVGCYNHVTITVVILQEGGN